MADVAGIFERAHAAKCQQAAALEHSLGVGPRADETMEDGVHRVMKLGVDGQCVFKRIGAASVAGMDDHVEFGGSGELEVLAQEAALTFAEGGFLPAVWWGMKVVEAGLTNRTHSRITDEGGELCGGIVRGVVDVAGMNTDASMNARPIRES